MEKFREYRTGCILLVVFIVFTVLVRCVSVQPIGPENSAVGFAKLNGAVFRGLGVHHAWYVFTEILGYLAIVLALAFVVLALIQCVKRRGFRHMDREVKALIGLYIAAVILYVFFEVVVVNCRPVLIDGVLEASYPSSHTMLSLCILGSALRFFHEEIKTRNLRLTAEAVTAVVMILLVVGRLLSGVHWFTDVIGGVLLGAALVSLYYSACRAGEGKEAS